MKIYGLQKTTLLDYPGHVACTVFTGGCNLRCPFCHNSSLIYGETLPAPTDDADFFDFLRKRKNILDGVCVSGGEPLLQTEIADFIKKIKDMGFSVKLDTNGAFPEKLRLLSESGLLDYVAMDIKSSLKNYSKAVGISGYDTKAVEESVKFLREGKIPFEFRTTAVRNLHEESDFEEMANWLSGADKLFLQPFKDSEGVLFSGFSAFSKEETEDFAAVLRKKIKNVEIRGI